MQSVKACCWVMLAVTKVNIVSGCGDSVVHAYMQEFGDEASDPEDIGDADLSNLGNFNYLIVGAL